LTRQTYTFKTIGDCQIQADVYHPPAGGARPVIIWIHGGALIGGSREGIHPRQLEKYLESGYVLVSIDYRLAPETKLPGIIDDLRDAFRWVRGEGPRLFGADPNRLGVIGHSAGGYLTLMSGFCVEPRPQALVAFYGYGDIVGPWYSRPDPFYCQQPLVPKEEAYAAVGGPVISRPAGEGAQARGRFYLYCRQNGLWPKEVVGHDPDLDPEAFHPFCPVRHVTPEYPPTLLLHGDADTDVPYEQSVMMAARQSQAGVEHELLTIAGGGHGFDGRMETPVVIEAFDRVLAFLKQHLA
jgi:acetyl esterase/lipase